MSSKIFLSNCNILISLYLLNSYEIEKIFIGIILPYKQENNISSVNESVVIYQANRIMELEKENEQLKEENSKLRVQSVTLIKKNKGVIK